MVASTNPVKVRATREAFKTMFPDLEFQLESLAVFSGVTDQPNGHAETMLGARNRAQAAQTARPDADFWVGIEGGVQDWGEEMSAFAWMLVRSVEQEGKSCTASFFLPHEVVRLVRSGMEMGEADDIVFNMNDSKRNQGASGILTHNIIDRAHLYRHALILALIPFKNDQLFANFAEDKDEA